MSGETGLSGRLPAQVPAPDRGATTIADRVLIKVASRAAYEVLATASERHEDLVRHHPAASVAVRSGTVRIRLAVELSYPVDIGAVCAALRREVAERVSALTGMDVPEVIVQVERLHRAGGSGERTGRVR